MFRDIRKNKVFNRRALIVSASQGGLTAILLARLSYLQIYKHKEYQIQSNSNSIKPFIKPAGRGIVWDRNGKELAQNKRNFRLYLYLEDKKNVVNIINELTKIINLAENKKDFLLAKASKARKRTVISLLDGLSWDDVARIEVNSYRLQGVTVENESLRYYPFARETFHFLGYVSLPKENEIKKNEKELFLHPSFRIGKTGLEKSFDKRLRGKYGVKYVEVNSLERPIRTISVKDPAEGEDIKTTIDIELQKYATSLIEKRSASIIVMDVKTGEILSYVSAPNFDGNKFVEGISQEDWDEVANNKRLPLNNRPISAIYPPGSTFKLITALAALEDGIDPTKKHDCKGHFYLGRRKFHCWKDEGHGKLNLIEAIERSCNVYFYHLAQELGIKKISSMARRFGYGEKININLYGSRLGNVPSHEWKEKIFKQPWVGGDSLNSAIGQGFVLATPLQMALATARMANGGVKIDPLLIKSERSKTQFSELESQKLVEKEYLDIVLNGMNNVVNNKKGTAFYRRIRKKGFEMAGKTGTAQVVSKREEEMTKAEKELRANRNHAIFVGFAPVHDPKFAVSVVVEHGGSGSYVAAPIGRDVLLKTQEIYS